MNSYKRKKNISDRLKQKLASKKLNQMKLEQLTKLDTFNTEHLKLPYPITKDVLIQYGKYHANCGNVIMIKQELIDEMYNMYSKYKN